MLTPEVAIVQLEGETVQDAVARLSEDPDVLHVQPNYIYHIQSFSYPSDGFFSAQW